MEGNESPRGKKLQKRRLESQFFDDESKRSKQSTQSVFSSFVKRMSTNPELQAKGSEKGGFSGTNSDKETVCCPLPKSKLLDRPKTSAPKVSDCKVKNGGQLPPPNMEYFIRKRMTPLKWTRPYNFSGFVLEDNSVVFIGTKKYEETLRRSFLNYLQGGTEDVDDFVARNFSKEKEKAEEAEVGGIVKANTKDVAQQKLENFKNTPTMVTVTNATAAGDITTTITAAPVADKAGSSFDGEDGGFSHSVRTEPSIEILEVDNYITFTQRAQEVDVGINETSQATSEQPASYFYLSSSSDDEELPKVQVTGRSMLPLKQLHKVAGTSDSRRYDKEHVVKEHVVKEHVVKEHVVVSGEDPNRTSQVTSGVSEGGAVVSDSSLQTGLPEECPICGVVFPPGLTQCEADEHIANCLSISINDLED